MNYETYFSRDPNICGGELTIKGTRITIKTILGSLAEGARIPDILKDYPTLTDDALHAVIAFAAASAEEDMPVRSAPSLA